MLSITSNWIFPCFRKHASKHECPDKTSRWHYLLPLLAGTCLCASLDADVLIEDALIQENAVEALSDTEDYTLYRIAQRPEDGFHWPYLLLIGKKLNRDECGTIYVETVNTGTVSNNYQFHEERGTTSLRILFLNLKKFEDKLIFMMPIFLRPKDDWKLYTHALDRDSMLIQDPIYKRLDLQVLAMVKDAKEILKDRGIETQEDFAIGGFSASGEFAQRFSILHPDSLSFVIAGGIGGLPVLPLEELEGKRLRYPIGIADLEEVSGKPFDQEKFFKLPRLLYYGSEDNNDPVKYNDAYDAPDRETVFAVLGKEAPERWLRCINVYERFDTASELLVDEGMGHKTSTEMFQNIYDFIQNQVR